MISQRFLIWILGFYACALMFTNRASLSVALVSMVKLKNTTDHHAGGSCLVISNHSEAGVVDKISGTYEWSETLQGIILGAQLYPNIFMPLVSGWLADRFGAKWLTAIAVMGPGLLSSLIPMAAEMHVNVLITLLFIMGACSACVFSALFSLYANWFPAKEMASATGALAFGANLGLVIMFPIAGYLCEYGNWPGVFYVTTLIHLPWIFGWWMFATDLPGENKRISTKELEFIRKHCAASKSSQQKVPVPWSKILKSKPVWASVSAKFAEYFGYYLLLTKMPAYLDLVFGLSMEDNGLLNSAVHLSTAVVELICGPLSAWVMKLNIFSLTTTRKIFESIGLIGPALCIVLVPYYGCDSTIVITLLIGSMTTYGFITGGEWPITAEFAPDFAGTVFGFCYVIGISTSFIAPIVAGVFLDNDPSDKAQWNTVFYITVVIYLIGALIFEMFASAEPQSWGVVTNCTEKQQPVGAMRITNIENELHKEQAKDEKEKSSAIILT